MHYDEEGKSSASSPKSSHVRKPEKDRMVENDMPFDQANDVAGTRAVSTSTAIGSGDHIDTDSHNHSIDQQAPDIEGSVCSPISTRFESIWLSSPEHSVSERNKQSFNSEEERTGVNKNGFAESGARFVVPPPKYSDPYIEAFKNQTGLRSPTNESEQNRPKDYPSHDSTPVNVSSIGNANEITFGKSQQEQDQNTKAKHKVRRRSRQRREQQILAETTCTDDDMSTENDGLLKATHSSSLQERSYQAWKSRQRKSSSIRSKQESDSRPKKGTNVSFGASNTIHRFETDKGDQNQYQNEDKEDNMSLDRSLNSEYTKTLESEVEDMIRDILFIGNPDKNKPGRRKYRYKSGIRRKTKKEALASVSRENSTRVLGSDRLDVLQETNADSDDDNESFASESAAARAEKKKKKSSNDLRLSKKRSSRSKHQQRATNVRDDKSSLASTISRGSSVDSNTVETFLSEKDTIDDPVNAIFGLVEGGLSIVSTAIGYALENYATNEDKESSIYEKKKSQNDFAIFESCGIGISDQKKLTVGDSQAMVRVEDAGMSSKKLWADAATSKNAIVVNNKLLGSSNARRDSETSVAKDWDKRSIRGSINEIDLRTPKTDRGSVLSELALYAARSVHKLQGVQYDESVLIDILFIWALKFQVIFLENDGGCFVTKVSPDGSAALSRRVEVGDQLASINGISSLKMKVDDICNVVGNSSDPNEIKLIFLRYIGPFRPKPDNACGKNDGVLLYNDVKSYSSRRLNTKQTTKIEYKEPATRKKKPGFRLFGRGKTSITKDDEKMTRAKTNVKGVGIKKSS
eukprot:jgi/Psemu1/291040/fgenesh1_pg.607_\